MFDRDELHRRMTAEVAVRGGENGIDSVLRKLLPDDPVVYVDVGAGSPMDCSNTWQFYEAGGHGLLVEPYPPAWYGLMVARPRDSLWPRAAGTACGWCELKLYESCSSLDHKWTIESHGTLNVECEPLDGILDRYPEIRVQAQLLSVDTEGTEEDVLESNDWVAFRPAIVVAEYRYFKPSMDSEARAKRIAIQMGGYGYTEVYRDFLNLVFAKDR